MPNSDSPVMLTPVAADKLIELHGGASPGPFVRLFVDGRTCCGHRYALAFEETPEMDDLAISHGALTLLVAARDQDLLAGATIDYAETAHGSGFTVDSPAAAGGCGCGG